MFCCITGTLVLGLLPVLLGCVNVYPVVKSYLFEQHTPVQPGLAFNIEIATCVWLMIAIQVHLYHVYFTIQLLSAWTVGSNKKLK